MKPYRIVLDSNVIISALLFDGAPVDVLRQVVRGTAHAYVSVPILDEVRDVLQRPKFGLSPDHAFALVEELHSLCRVVTPLQKINDVAADPDDNIVLECAAETSADVIVTGDKHLLALRQWQGIRIITPTEFLKE